MGDPTSTKISPAKGDHPAVQSEGLKKTQKVANADDIISTIISDSLSIFRKKFHILNDLVMKVPEKLAHACSPPPGFLMLIDILTTYGVSLSQLSYRVISIIMELIIFFRDHGVEKWEKQKDLSIPLHVRVEDLLKRLNLSDVDTLYYEVCYLSRYLDEEYLFKDALQGSNLGSSRPQYDVQVKALELECIEDGFIRGFMKGVRLVQHKTRDKIKGLTPSQASDDTSLDSDGDDVESELQKAFSLEEEDDIKIL
ncbi:hypothetical protein IEQ34_006307 [Dendrobium chrysotoxum]|uniref:Uncharacterized protein n=1 Tax=Dendrobium chrysotoxum TaxID=161865 RepID=A0AAV7HEK1_DENCH|nr:hypothetical protein IEQ34_006307 [Dendrobium chrysotoxum]